MNDYSLIESFFSLTGIFFLSLILLSSYVSVGLWIKYAKKKNLYDLPNIRSSHSHATPIGGGLMIAILFLSAIIFYYYHGLIEINYFLALIITGSLIGTIGFLDDLYNLSAKLRIMFHFIASIIGIYLLGGMPAIDIFGFVIHQGFLISLFGIFFLVWMINLYNFMDGINGIASIETITTTLGIALIILSSNDHFQFSNILLTSPIILFLSVTLSVLTLGFLFWNFPNAKVFLGDVGSSFLGYIIGLMAIQSSWIDINLFYSWLVLLACFITDSTLTLVYRVINKEKFYLAHKDHLYQLLSKYYDSHFSISISIGLVNILWLLPIAFLIQNRILYNISGLLIAYIPLIIIFIFLRFKLKKVI